jgi:lysyl-tRNA synthetase class 2
MDIYAIPEITVENSSNIASFGYDVERKVLAIRFKSGDLWHYAGVEFALAEQLSEADSKGRFFYEHVKGKFSAEKMTGPCPRCGARGRIGTKCDDCGTAHFEKEERRT